METGVCVQRQADLNKIKRRTRPRFRMEAAENTIKGTKPLEMLEGDAFEGLG